MKHADWEAAIGLFAELYAHELRDEAEGNLLLANNYAVALGKIGQPELAAQILERYFKSLGNLSTGFENLMATYEYLSLPNSSGRASLGLDLQFISPTRHSRPDAPIQQVSGSSSQNLPGGSKEKEVIGRLGAFLSAWRAGDINAYLGFYVPEQSPIKGVSHATWLEQRHERVVPDRVISLQSSGVRVTQGTNGRIVTEYLQIYRSAKYEDKTRKRLIWIRTGGAWRIENERSL